MGLFFTLLTKKVKFPECLNKVTAKDAAKSLYFLCSYCSCFENKYSQQPPPFWTLIKIRLKAYAKNQSGRLNK